MWKWLIIELVIILSVPAIAFPDSGSTTTKQNCLIINAILFTNDVLTFSNIEQLLETAEDNRFGTVEIPNNANEIQKEELYSNNAIIRSNVISSIVTYVTNSTISDTFKFVSMKKIYELKTSSSNKIWNEALTLVEEQYPYHSRIQKISDAKGMISYGPEPIGLGNEGDYYVYYDMIGCNIKKIGYCKFRICVSGLTKESISKVTIQPSKSDLRL